MADKKIHCKWVFHYAPRGRNSKVSFKNSDMYKEQIQYLGEFDTIKGFFEHYCFLKRPSDIPTDHKLMLFRENKPPLWEVSHSFRNISTAALGSFPSNAKKRRTWTRNGNSYYSPASVNNSILLKSSAWFSPKDIKYVSNAAQFTWNLGGKRHEWPRQTANRREAPILIKYGISKSCILLQKTRNFPESTPLI